MTDANTSSPAFPDAILTPPASPHLGWKTGRSLKVRRNPDATEHETESRSAWRERQRERERWCSWTCSSTTAADDGCTRRTTPSSELGARKTRRREREAERRSVTGRYALRSSAPTREERKRKRLIDRRTYHCLLNMLTSSVFLCVSQRG